MIRMLAEKAKQQEEMLVEYDEFDAHNKDMESEVELLRAQVDSIKEELKVGSPIACEQAHLFERGALTKSWREEWGEVK